ncbi:MULTISPECIES: class I SAM-dependent methyltransferase [Streptomyces]|nr:MULTISPECIES: class I SAM-dependent methyltransferase [Streptomyces]MBP5889694.1 methyltransferase domain-containing protein [Streptomyces sp. LBUM 1481]MBP5919721.1 methyltransferase domain-containing protein [Streptomyces sp. LBUM 1483]MDX2578123.1 class I SAM-dependent methyltransferase [Streptomyces scabiei]MDX2657462.1 class I SAM-dependent methyltransferase [Streptomyces scabiei]MDX2685711.1 class I SAM-dependent methyltransferase [Streptomyces scabiei]
MTAAASRTTSEGHAVPAPPSPVGAPAALGTLHPADPARWPDIVTVPPASRLRTAVTALLVRRALEGLPLRVRFAGSDMAGLGGPLLEVRDPGAFHARVGADGLVGFGESYMAGEWDAPDLVAALTVLAAHTAELIPAPLQRLRGVWAPRHPHDERNTPDGSRANISRHYDLSNDLFALFLDDTLTYSSALFRGFPATWDLLAAAQHRKIDRLLDLADVGAGTRLLEIGTGWGELALRAAVRGARVTSLTLSREQQALALERVRAAGLQDRVSIELCDYREARGQYDAVVSVEMIEAVGADFWPVYFRTLDERLAPGGRAALQAITMPHERMLATRSTFTWIHKYVFPGGFIPSTTAIEETVHDHTGLHLARRDAFGPHYAETLRLWRERFTRRADEVDALGFDETFRRLWTFYLAYSEAGFRSGYLDVQQYLFTKENPAR